MAGSRKDKMHSLLMTLTADFVGRNAGPGSLITLTDMDISQDEKEVLAYITVMPDSKEKAAVGFLNRQKRELKTYYKEHSKLRVLPQVEFRIDLGEKNRQRVDELSRM